jgi:DNA-binding CsgD family transcriptional regulator
MSNILKTVRQQSRQKLTADDRSARVLDAIDANIAVLDSAGFIIWINKGWREFAVSNPLLDGSHPRQVAIGANYLDACSAATGNASENAMLVHEGIWAVIDGRKRGFSHEYPCHSPDKQRWFLMKVKPLPRSKPREVVVTHIDITDRHLAETRLLTKQRELNTALLQLQEMAEKIKVSLGGQQLSAFTNLPYGQQNQPQGESDLIKSLSRREMEVLAGLVRGERNSAIASRLQLSRKSITTYRSRIFEKLKVENSVQLVAMISRTGALK